MYSTLRRVLLYLEVFVVYSKYNAWYLIEMQQCSDRGLPVYHVAGLLLGVRSYRSDIND